MKKHSVNFGLFARLLVFSAASPNALIVPTQNVSSYHFFIYLNRWYAVIK
jgi:hypothetical protein